MDKLFSGVVNVSHSRFNLYDVHSEDFSYSSNITELMDLLGYEKSHFLELCKNFSQNLVHPDDRACYANFMDLFNNSTGSNVFEIEYRIKRGDGEYIWISTRDMVYERAPDGTTLKILSASININERKNLVAKIEENLCFLEKLSYKNSHDMRGPVATIKGLLDLIEKDNDEMKSEILLSFFKRCINKLDLIIHEVNDEIEHKSR